MAELGVRASVVVACSLSSRGLQPLKHRFSSCGAQALLLRGMWDLPGPGLEPMSPALAGGFLTTAPPGKPRKLKIEGTFSCAFSVETSQYDTRQHSLSTFSTPGTP